VEVLPVLPKHGEGANFNDSNKKSAVYVTMFHGPVVEHLNILYCNYSQQHSTFFRVKNVLDYTKRK
jgi:hypothetical protein